MGTPSSQARRECRARPVVAVPMAATAPGAAHLVHGPSQVAMSVHSAFHLARLGAELPAAFLEKRCAQHGDDGQRRDPAGQARHRARKPSRERSAGLDQRRGTHAGQHGGHGDRRQHVAGVARVTRLRHGQEEDDFRQRRGARCDHRPAAVDERPRRAEQGEQLDRQTGVVVHPL